MAKRLTRIYTRTGDQGSTALGDGSRVAKDDLRIEVYGTLDELNSHLGLLLTGELPESIATELQAIQHLLFELGGDLCIPDRQSLTTQDVEQLEHSLDKFNAELPALDEFILPGGNSEAAQCHIARTVCRRCERLCTTLARESNLYPVALAFLNRLSDFLFVIARHLARRDGQQEILWQRRTASKSGKSV